jgi:hypothetical protein
MIWIAAQPIPVCEAQTRSLQQKHVSWGKFNVTQAQQLQHSCTQHASLALGKMLLYSTSKVAARSCYSTQTNAWSQEAQSSDMI